MPNLNSILNELDLGFRTKNISNELINSIIDLLESENFRATWHPVAGFIYLNIGSSGTYNYKFHIWHPNGSEIYKSQAWPIIHQHRWNLNSYIIKGEIVNDIYKIYDSTHNPTHSLYKVDHKNLEDFFLPYNMDVEVSLDYSICYLTGQFYEVLKNQFHSTSQTNKSLGATLVQTAKAVNSKAKILGPLKGVLRPMRRIECSKSELEYCFNLLRTSL